MRRATTGCGVGLAMGLLACSPALDWREIQPPESGAVVMFPCKPDRFVRSVTLAGQKVQMYLASCSAGGSTYALSHAALVDPTRIASTLEALRLLAASNIGGQATVLSALNVPGMTPHRLSERLAIQGRADGRELREEVGVFTRGLRVYQATVIGETLDAQATDTFFAGLRLTP